MSGFVYPHDLVQAVLQAWQKRNPTATIPDEAGLRRLVETAYHASMMTEEEKRLKFAIGFLEQNLGRFPLLPIANLTSWAFAQFQTPVEFTPQQICKLSLAARPERALLIAGPSEPPNPTWCIWGIYHTRDDWYHLNRHERESAGCPPEVLAVSSYGPGHLLVSYGHQALGGILKGRLTAPSSHVLHGGVVADKISRSIEEMVPSELMLRFGGHSREAVVQELTRVYRRHLHCMLAKACDRKTGGTIVVLPTALNGGAVAPLKDVSPGIFLSTDMQCLHIQAPPLYELAERYLDRKSCFCLEEELQQYSSLMADFASVDGALVLAGNLRPLALGAKLDAKTAVAEVFYAEDTKAEVGASRAIVGGTRHSSAVRFCDVNEGAVAFVLSQDGGVKALAKDKGRVVVWDNIDVGSMHVC